MKKGILFLFVLLVSLASVMAADPIINSTDSGNASVNVTLEVVDYTTIYHFDNGSSVGRNQYYPTFEYTIKGDNTHFWARIAANSVYALENADVYVVMDLYGEGTSVYEIPITFVTGIGATYNPTTGMYEGEFEGDLSGIDTLTMPSGNYELSIFATYGAIEASDDLNALMYENVNDVLLLGVSDINMSLQSPYGLVFNMIPLQFNPATDYPKHLTISSPVDREGQGVIGNVSIAVTNYVSRELCAAGGTAYDVVTADNIRMSLTGDIGSWIYLQANTNITTASAFTVLAADAATLGTYSTAGMYTNQMYFQLYFDSNHCGAIYDGGAVGVKYSIF